MSTAETKKSLKEQTGFRFAMIALDIAIMLFFLFSAPPEGLEQAGWRMLGILIVAMVMFISEAIPLPATCFLIIVLMKYTGVAAWKEIQQTAMSSTVFFCMAGFGIGAALKNTNLAAILMRTLYNLGKGDSKKMISAVLWLAAIISIFISDGAAQVVTLAVVTNVVLALGNPEPGTSRLAGGMMMAVCVGALTGGLFLPCSNSVNVAIMELSETVAGKPMTFFQWALFGVPCGFLMTLAASYLVPNYFKPESMTEDQKTSIQKLFETIPEKLQPKDWYYIVVTIVMVVCWFASNWVKKIDVATVAMAGMIMFMLPIPGLRLLTAKEYKQNFSHMIVVTQVCIFPMAAAMKNSGAGEWIVNKMFADSSSWGSFIIIIMATLAAFIIHILVPQGSSNGALSATILGPVLVAAGLPVAAAFAIIGVQAGTGFLFPIEGTWQYTFGTGHYKFDDCLKGNWKLTVFGILLCVILIPVLSGVFSAMGLIS